MAAPPPSTPTPVVVAMKGHPGTGKTTLARAVAREDYMAPPVVVAMKGHPGPGKTTLARAVAREDYIAAPAPSTPTPVVVAMKGHPGTGKSTLARAVAAALRCTLLDKDDVRDCTLPLQQSLSAAAAALLNDLSYSVLWRMTETQLRLGLSVVVDSPLSRRAHLDRLLEATHAAAGARVVVVECRPGEEAEWRRRLEARGAAAAAAGDGSGGWHKPATWRELQDLVEGYRGCTDYEVGGVPRLVVDTTAAGTEELVSTVIDFISANAGAEDGISDDGEAAE